MFSSIRRRLVLLKNFAAALLLILCFSVGAFGQANGKVSGTVSDPNGAAVSGAVVKLHNQATGIEAETTGILDIY